MVVAEQKERRRRQRAGLHVACRPSLFFVVVNYKPLRAQSQTVGSSLDIQFFFHVPITISSSSRYSHRASPLVLQSIQRTISSSQTVPSPSSHTVLIHYDQTILPSVCRYGKFPGANDSERVQLRSVPISPSSSPLDPHWRQCTPSIVTKQINQAFLLLLDRVPLLLFNR